MSILKFAMGAYSRGGLIRGRGLIVRNGILLGGLFETTAICALKVPLIFSIRKSKSKVDKLKHLKRTKSFSQPQHLYQNRGLYQLIYLLTVWFDLSLKGIFKYCVISILSI